jgi:hypothetical protein
VEKGMPVYCESLLKDFLGDASNRSLTSRTMRSHIFWPLACRVKIFPVVSNFFTSLWIQDFVGTLPSAYLFRNALWHCLNVRQYSRSINASFSAEYIFAAHAITLHWVKRLFSGRVSTSRVQPTLLRGVMVPLRQT